METVDRTFQIGARAFDLMRTYCLSAAPRSYEVWYAVVTGLKPALNRAMDRLVGDRNLLTDGDIDALYDVHFDTERLIAEAGRAGGEIVQEVDQVNELIDLALDETERFGRSLDAVAADGIEAGTDRARLTEMLRGMVSAANEMSATNRTLTERFRRSRQEIGRLRDELAQVQKQAMTDALTGLANRRMFDLALDRARDRAAATGEPLSLLFVDIDAFKSFNDRHGHMTGDQVLKLVASCMSASTGPENLIARLGGEEFVILLEGTSLGDAQTIAERIRRNVADRELVKRSDGTSLGRMTVSIGVVAFDGQEHATAMLARADRCVYAAKRAGRNRSVSERDAIYLAAA